jgi:hypothetical protein
LRCNRQAFFFTFCVSAEAAADFAALLADLERRIFDAALATVLLVVSFALRVCVSVEAATIFCALLADLLRNTFDADDAAFFPVLSVFAMDGASLL